ncbi:hypothetical protein B0H14DRAFT_2588447 [Mycena olivaceomarginata]|nr:hypothetical protein B0H14DRAFT_2588447 [Mycena olivaceomarginata]
MDVAGLRDLNSEKLKLSHLSHVFLLALERIRVLVFMKSTTSLTLCTSSYPAQYHPSIVQSLSYHFRFCRPCCGECPRPLWGWRRGAGRGTQAEADHGVGTHLGFSSGGPFDAAKNPILRVIPNFYHSLEVFKCGQVNSESYRQTTFGPVLSTTTDFFEPLCPTASARGVPDITLSLLPCV